MAPPNTFRKLQDKHVLVLGGTSGIGFAVAQGALADGARVTVASSTSARVDKAVQTLKEQNGPGAVVQGFVCDVSTGDIESTLETLIKSATSGPAGELNHIVYTAANSASMNLGTIAEANPATILAGAQMRMFVPIMLAKLATRYLPKSIESSLTFTSGQASDKPPPGWSLMLFFTGGVQTFAKGLAVDLAPTRVNVVLPGAVDTELWNIMPQEQKEGYFAAVSKKLLAGSIGRPEDVAEAYLWLLKDRFATGTFAASNGGALLV
ncbi:short chain dehydrogenase [Ophiostoma piceae UAMH 11346]|uniref:Short chain dehydrogenase n=1 Tax=Ophiostoma piceae (strain UAMH 11346) TaxID=1262450 RepID=S3BVN2_OPHP1|nr:short chain dehydrogenase [Ophiostoma piceae UAMH 11346]